MSFDELIEKLESLRKPGDESLAGAFYISFKEPEKQVESHSFTCADGRWLIIDVNDDGEVTGIEIF